MRFALNVGPDLARQQEYRSRWPVRSGILCGGARFLGAYGPSRGSPIESVMTNTNVVGSKIFSG